MYKRIILPSELNPGVSTGAWVQTLASNIMSLNHTAAAETSILFFALSPVLFKSDLWEQVTILSVRAIYSVATAALTSGPTAAVDKYTFDANLRTATRAAPTTTNVGYTGTLTSGFANGFAVGTYSADVTFNTFALVTSASGTAAAGGSLAVATYYYVITPVSPNGGEGMPVAEFSQTSTAANATITLAWTSPAAISGVNPIGYNIYRATTANGNESFLTFVPHTGGSASAQAFSDSGAVLQPSAPFIGKKNGETWQGAQNGAWTTMLKLGDQDTLGVELSFVCAATSVVKLLGVELVAA